MSARILICDDEVSIRRVLQMWLERQGYTVIARNNGAEALAAFDANEIDMIISDMNMPQMSGRELAEAVRERGFARLPFLLLSARCDQSRLTKELEAFDVTVFSKPFMPSRIVDTVRAMLEERSVGEVR